MDEPTQKLLRYYALRHQITDHEVVAALDRLIARLQAMLADQQPGARAPASDGGDFLIR
jgi:hypothetical protein